MCHGGCPAMMNIFWHNQSDQIGRSFADFGRIFADWARFSSCSFLKMTEVARIFGQLYSTEKSTALILIKMGLGRFFANSYVWSPWAQLM
jgi:hypothetical protein